MARSPVLHRRKQSSRVLRPNGNAGDIGDLNVERPTYPGGASWFAVSAASNNVNRAIGAISANETGRRRGQSDAGSDILQPPDRDASPQQQLYTALLLLLLLLSLLLLLIIRHRE